MHVSRNNYLTSAQIWSGVEPSKLRMQVREILRDCSTPCNYSISFLLHGAKWSFKTFAYLHAYLAVEAAGMAAGEGTCMASEEAMGTQTLVMDLGVYVIVDDSEINCREYKFGQVQAS